MNFDIPTILLFSDPLKKHTKNINMKKQLFLLLSLAVFCLFTLQAQNPVQISGHVTNELNGDPVANHDVHIMVNDSSIFYSTVATDQNGFYFDTIQPAGYVINSLYILTNDLCWYGVHDTLIMNPGGVEVADFEICVDTSTTAGCQAGFYYFPDSTNQYVVYFMDNSTSGTPIESWFWDFGDGTSSVAQFPTHIYNAGGTYTVCLTITADSGACTSVSCMDVVIGGGGLYCMADFTYALDSTQGYMVYFYDQSIPQNFISSYSWSFGDGGTSTLQNPLHQYSVAGTYNVCLTIESMDSGMICTDTYCMDVMVNGNGGTCMADFFYVSDSSQNNTVYFYDQSTPANTITSYSWNFGDGNYSILQNPVHQYAAPGTYYVCLSIISQYGGSVCTDTYCTNVMVSGSGPACEAGFYYAYDSTGAGSNIVMFYDMSTPAGLIESWYWSFGDGNYSTEQNPVHTYAEAGNYGVCLTITADSGTCTSSYCDTIAISIVEKYQLGGNVFAGMYQLDNGFAYAYRSDNGVITDVYSEMIDTLGYYQFYPLTAADYYTKAEPSPNSAFFGQYMPTYYGDVVTWDDAVLIPLSQNIYTADINLVPVAQGILGPGAIAGTVVHGSVLRNNEPAVGIQIMLKNEQGNFVGLAYTDQDGVFEFTSLPYGTFTLMAEEMGIAMTPEDFVISEDQASIEDIAIIMTEDEFYFGPSGIQPPYGIVVSNIYPNPVKSSLKIHLSAEKTTWISYRVINQAGQTILSGQAQLEREKLLDVNTAELRQGMYLIEIRSEDGSLISRPFVKM